MCTNDILGFEDLDSIFKSDNAPKYSETQFLKLRDAAKSLLFTSEDGEQFFEAMLEVSVYLCLLNIKQRDIIFFDKLRLHDDEWELIPAAHDAKRFIMEECCKCIPFFKGSVLDEIDVVLGTMICMLNGKFYSLEKICASPDIPESFNFPDAKLLLRTRKTAQSLFQDWDSADRLLYTSRPFCLILCLYLKYRFAYGRDRAVRMIYGVNVILGMKGNEDFFDLVYKAITLVDGAYSFYDIKYYHPRPVVEHYRPAVVLWHIVRVLRRMSEGFACDEWMTCGCESICDSCEARIAPGKAENTGDKETDEVEDEYVSDDEDDSDEDDLYYDDLNDFEEMDSSEWEKYRSDTD